jgi:hypothetical protein
VGFDGSVQKVQAKHPRRDEKDLPISFPTVCKQDPTPDLSRKDFHVRNLQSQIVSQAVFRVHGEVYTWHSLAICVYQSSRAIFCL